MIMLGYSSTTPVTMEDMITHQPVVKGAPDTWVAGDLFGSYQESDEQAVHSATLIKETGCDCIKLKTASKWFHG